MLIATIEGLPAYESRGPGYLIAEVDGFKLGIGGDWYVQIIACSEDDDAVHPMAGLISGRNVKITIEAVLP